MVDLIEATITKMEISGVTLTQSRCRDNKIAYKIDNAAVLIVPVNKVFSSGIPNDFSILTVAKLKAGESIDSCKKLYK